MANKTNNNQTILTTRARFEYLRAHQQNYLPQRLAQILNNLFRTAQAEARNQERGDPTLPREISRFRDGLIQNRQPRGRVRLPEAPIDQGL